jgi:cobalt-zinc-cadmium resistance protein CzcA
MAVLIPMAMALILVLLYALFSSFAYSLLALVAVPFTVACGILALFVSDQVISISAVIGFVSLLGVSVMDGILILSYFKELRLAGKSAEDAVYEAYIHRMRPLLMTAFSACIGLFRPPSAMASAARCSARWPPWWWAACCWARCSFCWWCRPCV